MRNIRIMPFIRDTSPKSNIYCRYFQHLQFKKPGNHIESVLLTSYAYKIMASIILFFLQVFPYAALSQTNHLKFTHLTTGDGLSQNTVYAVLKDYRGFMWFATDEGLNKYDGYKFTVYKHDPEDLRTISDNSVYGLLEDAEHNLWIVSAGGLDKFDRLNESFIHYKSGLNAVVFKNIFQDSKNRIWIGSSEGFCLFDISKRLFKFYKHDPGNTNSLSQDYVYKITEDNYGELWIGTRNGLNRFNPETKKFVRYHNERENNKSIGSGYIKTVFKDSKGSIWIGTQGSGVALFNRAGNSFINFRHDENDRNSVCYNDILSFTQDVNGKLWVGTENGGISIYDYEKNTFSSYRTEESDPFSISGNSVYSLYKDNIGNMWAGTWSGGVNMLPFFGDKFIHYKKLPDNGNSLSNNIVLSINGDAEGNIWIGTDGGGLNKFDPVTNNFTKYLADKKGYNKIYSDYVLSVSPYTPGVVALGLHRGGIDLFDVKKQLFTHYAPGSASLAKLTSSSVNIVYADRQNNLWAGLNDNGGLYLLDSNTKKFTPFFADNKGGRRINDSSIFIIYESRAGQLWIGGDKGLDLFDRTSKEFIHHQHDPKNKQSLSNNSVFAISEDFEGNLWLGTPGGLNYFNVTSKIFKTYTEKDGLPNNTVLSIQHDHQKNIWISTNKGLSRFNPSTKVFRNFTIKDGLQSTSFKGKSSYQTPGGEMYFGGVNGFNTFYPDSIKDNNFVPPVYITDFHIFNKPVGIGGNSPLKQSISTVKEIVLSYRQSVFTIEFAALNFNHPEQNLYAYKLQGFDKEWNYSENKRTATYTNLNPGTYIFKVNGSNNDGVWNKNGASVKIIIKPPFWLTWWFKLLATLTVAGSAIALYRHRVSAINKQKINLQQQVQLQTRQLLKSTEQEHKARREAELANLHLERKNKELEQFAYIASHDLQEPLRTTSSFVGLIQKQYKGQLDERADRYFYYVLDASERMKVLIKNLLDYSRIGYKKELQQVDCNAILENVLADLHVAIQEAHAEINFATLPVISGYATELKQLFQNLVVNAIKFRKKDTVPQIAIAAQKLQNEWQFSIKDNGIGIEEKHTENIFNIFQRLHSRTEYEGSGIGLSYCKKIVELHNGKIWVTSTPNEGSTFYFTIHSSEK